ncbi:deddh [Caudoviricetes sp.]|nr:deddh [Caudoviricetes sp.]
MRLFFFDTETGGLEPAECGLTEVSSLIADFNDDLSGWNVVHRFSSLVKPIEGLLYTDEALTTQNRTLDQLEAEGRDEAEVIQALGKVTARYFGEAKKCNLWAHNSGFDIGFLEAATKRTGLPMPTNFAHVCTMHLFRGMRFAGFHDCYRSTLDDMMRAFGVRLPDEIRHTATGDVEALAACTFEMLRRLRAGIPAGGN